MLERTEQSLPARFYRDPDHYRRELEIFWHGSWLYACRSSDLPASRHYKVVEVGEQSVVLARDSDGRLRGFHNTCRHRGSLLCTEPEGRFRGPAIVCPYHGWTYSLRGELVGTPHQVSSPDFRRQDYSLYPVAVAEWAGCVFVDLRGEHSTALGDALGDIPARLAHWPLEKLAVGYRCEREVACNWKIFWENFSECFHCPGVHPELCRIVPAYARGLLDADDLAATGREVRPAPPGGLAPDAITWSLDGGSDLPIFPDLTESERRAGHTFGVLWPGFFIVAHVDYVRIARILARGPERTGIAMEWLFDPAVLARADFDLERATELGRRVVEQDARVCEFNQRGLHSIRHAHGVLVAQEYGVREFQHWVRRGLGDETQRT